MMSAKNVYQTDEIFPEDLVQEQIQRIFLCHAFSVSDILRRFLTYIIDETLAGRSNTIKEYTIAVNVLNKPISFKPQHDAIVRIHAGRLRRALNYYYKEQGIGEEIEISVPKGSYVPVFGRMHTDESKAVTDPNDLSNGNTIETVTVVVMPFSCLEMNISRLAFTDGLGRQLSGEFGKFPDFSVISYYSTQRLTSKNKEINSLATNFGAQYVVTGNVQFESRKLRVDVQLTDTQTGVQIWTALYHYSYGHSGFFEVADKIVARVMAALGDFNGLIVQQIAKGLAIKKSGRPCTALLSSYYDFYSNFNEEGFKKAYAAMENAVERMDQSRETAWAFLGELSLLAFLFNQTTRENPVIQALRYANIALKLNPLSQHGHITLGMTHIFMNNKTAGLEALEYAYQLNPNASGSMGVIGCLFISAGEYNRGIELIEKSIELNKSFPAFFHLFISLYHFKKKEYFLAFQEVEKMGMPGLVLSIILRISTLSHMGRSLEAHAEIRALRRLTLNKIWISRDYIHRFLLDTDLADELYKELKSTKFPLLTVA